MGPQSTTKISHFFYVDTIWLEIDYVCISSACADSAKAAKLFCGRETMPESPARFTMPQHLLLFI